jgi:hypothetical protein
MQPCNAIAVAAVVTISWILIAPGPLINRFESRMSAKTRVDFRCFGGIGSGALENVSARKWHGPVCAELFNRPVPALTVKVPPTDAAGSRIRC